MFVKGRVCDFFCREDRTGSKNPSLGLHLGDVLYGNVGSDDRLDFTVVGPAVNEVSRIEGICRSLDRDLIISSAFVDAAGACTSRIMSLGRYVLRGRPPTPGVVLPWCRRRAR